MDGHVLRVCPPFARHLLTPDCAALHALGRQLPFELVVGLNGLVWVRAAPGPAQVLHTLLVRNCVLNAEFLLLQSLRDQSGPQQPPGSGPPAPLAAQMEAMVQLLVANSKQLQ